MYLSLEQWVEDFICNGEYLIFAVLKISYYTRWIRIQIRVLKEEKESLQVRFAKYLEEFCKLRISSVADAEKYSKDGSLIWYASIPEDRDCYSPVAYPRSRRKKGQTGLYQEWRDWRKRPC